jgi:hypothetical protein
MYGQFRSKNAWGSKRWGREDPGKLQAKSREAQSFSISEKNQRGKQVSAFQQLKDLGI